MKKFESVLAPLFDDYLCPFFAQNGNRWIGYLLLPSNYFTIFRPPIYRCNQPLYQNYVGTVS